MMENWPETVVGSWPQLQEAFDRLVGGHMFRGQGGCDWPLEPSFNRFARRLDEQSALELERHLILRFRSEAHLYLPPSVMPPNLFKLSQLDTYVEWLMLMQHYGAPTRLLDWSRSPYVATYFAVDEQWDADGAIWYFDPAPAVKAIYDYYQRPVGEFLDYADMPAQDILRGEGPPLLYTAEKKMRTPREVAQQGCFTFTSRLLAHHQDVVYDACRDCSYGRILIPKGLKREFVFRLTHMNVTAATLFPGLEGICNSLRDTLRLATSAE